jgi:hypothetical protein
MDQESDAPTNQIVGETINIQEGGAALIKGNTVNIKEGGAALIVGQTVSIEEGGSGILVAEQVELKKANVVLLAAKNVSGEANVFVDLKAAALFGLVVGLIIVAFKRFIGRRT